MKTLIFWLGLFPLLVSAQNKTEIREFTGKVVAIEPSWNFAFECIQLDTGEKKEHFLFWPNHGKYILSNVKVGDQATVRVEVNLTWQKRREELELDSKMRGFFHLVRFDRIIEIQINGQWVPLPYHTNNRGQDKPAKVFLEQPILRVYPDADNPHVFVFANGVVGNLSFIAALDKNYQRPVAGDIVSFLGTTLVPSLTETAAFPLPDVKHVYVYTPLFKASGNLKSMLYKQNSVCIGLVMTSGSKEFKFGFPSDYATRVMDFLKGDKVTDFYYLKYKVAGQPNPFELHGLISGTDTLKIERAMFYGGEDVEHEHKIVEVSGPITRVVRSPNHKIMSILVGDDAYVEISAVASQQLDKLLRNGVQVWVKGKERIKKEGEVYLERYRIIAPRNMTIDGKEFLLI